LTERKENTSDAPEKERKKSNAATSEEGNDVPLPEKTIILTCDRGGGKTGLPKGKRR